MAKLSFSHQSEWGPQKIDDLTDEEKKEKFFNMKDFKNANAKKRKKILDKKWQ